MGDSSEILPTLDLNSYDSKNANWKAFEERIRHSDSLRDLSSVFRHMLFPYSGCSIKSRVLKAHRPTT